MTETKTVRLTSTEDVLAMVPSTLGFHPTESLVLMAVGGLAPCQARVDLPQDRGEQGEVADYLATAVARSKPTAVLVVVYSVDADRAESAGELLRARCVREGLEVPIAVRADGRRWFPLRGTRRRGDPHPPEGTPYDLASHPLTSQAVVDGHVVLPSREALRDTLAPGDPTETAAVAEAVAGAERLLAGSARAPLGSPRPDAARQHLVREGQWVRRRVRAFLRDRARLDARDVGRLLVALRSIEVRDVAWSEMRRATAGTHVDLWSDVVRRSPAEAVAPAAGLLAFAAWLSGHGALAWCAVERCQGADPGYGLAGLVAQALAGAVPPHVWTPPEECMLSLFADGAA